MKVHLRTQANVQMVGADDSEVSVNAVFEGTIRALASLIGLPIEALSAVWIVADEEYGSTISEIAPDEGYTENEMFLGAAKAIHRKDENGAVENVVVLRDWVFFPACKYLVELAENSHQEIVQTASPAETGELHASIVLHELGHCKDAVLRNEQFSQASIIPSQHWIARWNHYYTPILASEFAACLHSSLLPSTSLFSYENEETKGTASKIANQLKHIKTEPGSSQERLDRVAQTVPGLLWMLLIQYGKLVGSKLGQPNFRDMEIQLWDGCSEVSATIMRSFFRALADTWEHYPNWSLETFAFALRTWHELAESFDYQFVAGAESDRVFLH